MLDLRRAAFKLVTARLAWRNRGTDRYLAENLRRFQQERRQAARLVTRPSYSDGGPVEIVVPCFNHGPFLERTFESVLWQTWRGEIRLTLVNDASTDDSLETMRRIAARPSRIQIRVIDNPVNLNQAGSINAAVAATDADLLMILNADDLLTPDCVALTMDTYRQNPEIFMLGGSSLWFESDDELPVHTPKPYSELELTRYGPADISEFTHLNAINLSHTSSSFFRGAWEAVGGYRSRDERVCSYDDRDFQMRVCSLFPIGIYEDYPMEFYRTTSSKGRATV